MYYTVTIQNEQGRKWALPVKKSTAVELEEAGFEISFVRYSIPEWAMGVGLAPLWMLFTDIWFLPSYIINRSKRKAPD